MKNIFLKKRKIKIGLIVLGSFIIMFLVSIFPASAIETLLQYPTIGGQNLQDEQSSLPGMIGYVYLFAVGICGAVALASILLGAIRYIGAAGNPSKMSDAKDQIFSALLGVVILLSSYLILNTINPDLVRLNVNLATTSSTGGRACYCTDSYDTALWHTYPTPEECAALCDDECYENIWDSGACRAQ